MVWLRGSFLVRWWVRDDGGARIELTHIQSDAKVVAGSIAEALAWIQLIAAGDAGIADELEPDSDEQTPPGARR